MQRMTLAQFCGNWCGVMACTVCGKQSTYDGGDEGDKVGQLSGMCCDSCGSYQPAVILYVNPDAYAPDGEPSLYTLRQWGLI